MSDRFSRNELYWGKEIQQSLKSIHIAIFGLGGVGGYSAEALARAGVGELTLVDFDKVSESNLNRQIIALNSTIGADKTELFRSRLTDINPEIKLNIINDFYREGMNFGSPDYVIDAIDTLRSKVDLLKYCVDNKIPVISSMGAGNRIDPTQLYVCDISEIEDKKAPFVSNVIYQLAKKGIESGVEVIVSREKPYSKEKIKELEKIKTASGDDIEFAKVIPASTPFVASTAGIIAASCVVKKILMV